MDKYTKKEAETNLGKTSMFTGSFGHAVLTYVAGIENFDPTIIEGMENLSESDKSLFFKEPFVTIKQTKNDCTLFQINSIPVVYTGFKNSLLKEVLFDDAEDVVEAKDKSIIGRAIVGGLLLGPLGAILGGVSGIGKKEKTLMHGKSLIYFNSEKETLLILGCDNKMKHQSLQYLKIIFNNKLRIVK